MRDKIAKWYAQGLWTEDMVRTAADKGVITEAEAEEILNSEAERKGPGRTRSLSSVTYKSPRFVFLCLRRFFRCPGC